MTPCFMIYTPIYRGFSEVWRSVVRHVFTEGSGRCDAALSGRNLPIIQTGVCIPYDEGSRLLWRSDSISLRRLSTVFWPTCGL